MIKCAIILLWALLRISRASSSTLSTRAPQYLYHSVMMAPTPSAIPSETIVMMHGLLGNAKNFQSIVKLLQSKLETPHDIVVFDLRSHGRSKALGDLSFDYKDMADDVLHTCGKLKLSKVHLIGHSMGGKVAAAACLAQQSDISILSASILDISPIEYTEEDFHNVLDTIDFLENATKSMTESTSKKDMTRLIEESFDDQQLRMFLGSNLVENKDKEKKGRGVEWRFSIPGIVRSRSSLLAWDFGSEHPPFRCPLLLLKGSESSLVKASHLEHIKQHFPLYSLQSIKGAGHWLHADKPEETAIALANFLKAAREWHITQE